MEKKKCRINGPCERGPDSQLFDPKCYNDKPLKKIGRIDAMHAKQTVYWTGKPCRWGHINWRYTSSGACIDCCYCFSGHEEKEHYHMIERAQLWLDRILHNG